MSHIVVVAIGVRIGSILREILSNAAYDDLVRSELNLGQEFELQVAPHATTTSADVQFAGPPLELKRCAHQIRISNQMSGCEPSNASVALNADF